MTAYRNNFIIINEAALRFSTGDGNSGSVSSSNTRIEPVIINHEFITDNNGDIVMTEVANVT